MRRPRKRFSSKVLVKGGRVVVDSGDDGEETKLTPAEARELLEAARDQEKPLIFSPDKDRLTNERMPEIRRRKNW